ncbi:MAG: transcription termination/antitermination protein NusA, partial [Chloroflexota bacterium]|nr:transcription termination/antitermination protein NusA [Chloroflexota bacterium]
RGLRVQAIVNELGGEKIDIIEWAESPERYVANALEPAHVVRVDIVPEEKTAYVIVPDRQLSLAIGKEGQNARLAAKLTGWRIDIRSESEVRAEVEPEPEPEPVAVAEPVPAEEESEIRHDLVAEVEAESAQADEEDLDEEDRALLGGKKKRAERR